MSRRSKKKVVETSSHRASEEMHQALFEQATDGIFIADEQGRYVEVNRRGCQMLGYTRQELLGLSIEDLIPAEDLARNPLQLDELQAGKTLLNERRLRCKDGRLLLVEINARMLADGSFLSMVRDISKRKQTERELQRSNDLLRAIIEAAPVAIIGLDLGGNVQLVWNPAAENMLGWNAQEVMGRPLPSVPAESREEFRRFREQIRSGKTLDGVEVRRQRRDGSPIDYSIYASPLRDTEGRITGNISVLVDITEQKKAEEALRASEERLQLALDAAQMGQWEWNIVTGDVVWSQQCLALYGLPPDTQISYKRFLQALHPEDRERIDAALRRAVEERAGYDEPKRIVWPDGSIHWTASRGQVYCDAAGQPIRMIGVTFDITKWKEAEEALQKSHQELQRVMASVSDYLWSGEVDEEGNWGYNYYSPVVEKITGRPPAYYLDNPQRWLDTIHPDDRPRLLEVFQRVASGQSEREEEEYRVIRPDGTICWVRDCTTVTRLGSRGLHIDGVVSDITERKQAEESLQKSHEELRAFFSQTIDGCFFMMLDEPVRWDETTDKEEVLDYVFAHQHITQINEAMLAQYGATREQMLKFTPNDFFKHNLAHGRDLWRQLFDAGKVRLESDERKLDGTPMWIEGEYILLYDSKGRITGHFGIQRDITERKQLEAERQTHLWFLESLDQVNRAMHGTNDLEQMMSDVLDVVLTIFDCDRAWLVYPCDPQAASWRVPMERARPQYPGAYTLGLDMPMDPEIAKVMQIARSAGGPVQFGPGSEYPLPTEVAKQFSIQSQLLMATYPKVDKPYIFGLHQCSYPRDWTSQEERLFQEIGRRLADGLTSLLSYRNLHESERKLGEAEHMAHVGWWDRDYEADTISLSDEACRIFGLPLEEQRQYDLVRWHERWKELIHPEDRPVSAQAAEEALQGGPRYDVEYRVIRPNGEVRFVRSQGDVTWNESGRPRRMFGIMQDITELRQAEDELRASEARFRTLVDHAADAFYLHDARGTILDVNRQACESLGYSREELIGMAPYDFDVGLDRSFIDQINARLDAGEVFAFDTQHRRKDGSVFPVEVRTRPFWEGKRRFGVSLARDITERKQADEALRASEARFRAFVDHAADAFFLLDDRATILDVNRQACESLGYSRQELIGMSPLDFDVDVDRSFIEQIQARLAAGEMVAFDTHHRRKDGSVFPVEIRSRSFWQGERRFVVSLVRDITERKQAQEALTLFRSLIDHANDMIEVIDPETGRFLDVNEQACLAHGYTREEYLALTVPQINPLVSNRSWQKTLEEFRRSGSLVRESQHRRKDGSVFPVEINVNYIRLDRDYVLAVVRDITERKQAEEALRASEERYRALFHENPSMFFTLDAKGSVISVNDFGAGQLGYTKDELEGQSVLKVFYEEDKAAVSEQLKDCLQNPWQVYHWQFRKVRKDGSLMWVEEFVRAVNGPDGVIYVLVVCQDITERKQLEAENEQLTAQFYQAQKMEAIGQLAGGIAHDFNNLLVPIIGYIDLSLADLSPGSKLYADLRQVRKAADRAADLTRQILAFSRQQVLELSRLDLNMIIDDFKEMLQRLIGEDIELQTFLTPALFPVKADKGQVEQVLMNLVINSRDAMPAGGKLTIETANAFLDEVYVKKHAGELEAGHYVMLAVSDTGQGMDAETQKRIFDPFFTTKESGKGTGLGLATVFGIIKQHQGHIWVYSEPGNGTTFKVYLPKAEETFQTTINTPKDPISIYGTETVLVVEDEEMTRKLVCETLEAHGYDVVEAQSPNDCLELASGKATVHLLLTDVIMPEMNGKELYQKLMAIHPNSRVLYMSGYTNDVIVHHGILDEGINFLQKPFTIHNLTRKVREILN